MFYFYSTVAQTLAGATGFLGAFVLFYLQNTNRKCENLLDSIQHQLEKSSIDRVILPALWQLPSEYWNSFAENFKTLYLEHREKTKSFRALKSKEEIEKQFLKRFPQYSRLKSYADKQQLVRSIFKPALFLTAVAIVISLIALVLVPTLVKHQMTSGMFLILVLGLSIICITKYARMISALLGRQPILVRFSKNKQQKPTDKPPEIGTDQSSSE